MRLWGQYALFKRRACVPYFCIHTVIFSENAAGMTKYSEVLESLKQLYIDDARPWLVYLN